MKASLSQQNFHKIITRRSFIFPVKIIQTGNSNSKTPKTLFHLKERIIIPNTFTKQNLTTPKKQKSQRSNPKSLAHNNHKLYYIAPKTIIRFAKNNLKHIYNINKINIFLSRKYYSTPPIKSPHHLLTHP